MLGYPGGPYLDSMTYFLRSDKREESHVKVEAEIQSDVATSQGS